MSLYVLDAGVAIKWFIREDDSVLALKLLQRYERGDDQLIAPDLLIPECGNVLWKRSARGDLTAQEAVDSLNDLLGLNFPLTPSSTLVRHALSVAQTYRQAVYDCLYLSLAITQNCQLLTADERFFKSLSSTFPQIQLLRRQSF
ncbi:MAG: type II toxin-antitoxin system VapC family toxin [Acidobacteriota bacterium]|nr:type II toxin-antitoxin system VapC family toxin [Acidobacteriota bacterium]